MIVTLPPDNLQLTLPDLQMMVLGPPNSGKSHLAASAEAPIIVLAADPASKLQTYFNRGLVDSEIYVGPQGQPTWLVRSVKTGNVIIQVEGYYDEEETNPQAMNQLLARVPQIGAEVKQGRWRTVVIDSWTQVEWIARLRRSFGPFATSDSSYFAAMQDLENMVKARLMNLRCNLIIVFHIETKVVKNRKGEIIRDARVDAGGGDMTYSVQAIGSLKNIANVLGECYLAVAPIDGSDNYTLQTRKDADFRTLESRIKAPNPCINEWKELFGPWMEREATKRRALALAQASATAQPAAAGAVLPQEGVQQ